MRDGRKTYMPEQYIILYAKGPTLTYDSKVGQTGLGRSGQCSSHWTYQRMSTPGVLLHDPILLICALVLYCTVIQLHLSNRRFSYSMSVWAIIAAL